MLEAAQWHTPTWALSELDDVGVVEMNAVREPHAGREPARLLQKIDGPAAEHLVGEPLLVHGLGEVGVQWAVVRVRELGGGAHQAAGHGERRAGRQPDLHHAAGSGVMKQLQHALAVEKDGVLVLHDLVGRQTAVLLREIHGTARGGDADAQRLGFLDLDIDVASELPGEQIVMVGGRRAARHEQFGQGKPHTQPERVRREARPQRIERVQPGKQFLVDRGGMRARQRLKEVVVRVDEARQHDMGGGIEDGGDWLRRFTPARDAFADGGALDDEAAFGAVGENGKRILDPDRCVRVVWHGCSA